MLVFSTEFLIDLSGGAGILALIDGEALKAPGVSTRIEETIMRRLRKRGKWLILLMLAVCCLGWTACRDPLDLPHPPPPPPEAPDF
jgi:hypothetical protein